MDIANTPHRAITRTGRPQMRPARRLRARAIAKWCAGAVVLFMPGTLIVLALLWLARRYMPNGTRA